MNIAMEGKLFAFEPIPITYKRLTDTIAMNSLNNVTDVSAAVSNVNGKLKMFLSHTLRGIT